MIKFILTDLGGTTTSNSFVQKKLFPYAVEQMETFIKQNKERPEVQKILSSLSAEQGCGLSLSAASDLFKEWISAKNPHPLLIQIETLIWKEGFESEDLKAHVYSDVPEELKKWKDAGLMLGVYSSAPVEVQKLFLKYSELGDLTPYLSVYFDPEIGPKTELESYQKIARKLGLDASEVLFLSDLSEEIEAAAKAGMKVTQVYRDGVPAKTMHTYSEKFSEVELN